MAKSLLFLLVLITLSLIVLAEEEQPNNESQSPGEKDANEERVRIIKDRIKRMQGLVHMKIDALNNRNCKLFAQFFADDAISVDPSVGAIRGRDKLQESCESFVSLFKNFYMDAGSLKVNFQDPAQALLDWKYIAITADDCSFYLEGQTHYDFINVDTAQIRVQRETDFYSLQEMRNGIRCNKEVGELPQQDKPAALEGTEKQKMLEKSRYHLTEILLMN